MLPSRPFSDSPNCFISATCAVTFLRSLNIVLIFCNCSSFLDFMSEEIFLTYSISVEISSNLLFIFSAGSGSTFFKVFLILE